GAVGAGGVVAVGVGAGGVSPAWRPLVPLSVWHAGRTVGRDGALWSSVGTPRSTPPSVRREVGITVGGGGAEVSVATATTGGVVVAGGWAAGGAACGVSAAGAGSGAGAMSTGAGAGWDTR